MKMADLARPLIEREYSAVLGVVRKWKTGPIPPVVPKLRIRERKIMSEVKYPSYVSYLITTRDEALSIVIRSEQWLKGLGCLASDTMPGRLKTDRVLEVIRKEKEGLEEE